MYGKLLAYLRDHRTRQDFYNFSEDSAALTSRDLTVFGYCVARGMEYLASKKVIFFVGKYSVSSVKKENEKCKRKKSSRVVDRVTHLLVRDNKKILKN